MKKENLENFLQTCFFDDYNYTSPKNNLLNYLIKPNGFTNGFNIDNGWENKTFYYKISSKEDENNLSIKILLPGVNKEDLELSAETTEGKNVISISVSDKSEFLTGFNKIYTIDSKWDLDQLKADLKNGILYINIKPKNQSKHKKLIKIE